MKLCRFTTAAPPHPRVGVTLDGSQLHDLSAAGVPSLAALLETEDPAARVREALASGVPAEPLAGVTLLPPVDGQEVWAAGVTYLRSKKARMEESEFSATAYDRVYEAERPEIFFKSVAGKVVGPGGGVGIRRDARWSVPEPELALVTNSRGRLVGCTIGNDM
ncbi:MAG: fumarylacetoacetate hydrolase, partial [Verrucomicrobiota bacterium]